MFVEISEAPIPDLIAKTLFQPPYEHGGRVEFRGLIRAQNQGRTVTALSYDAYAPLARKVLEQIGSEAREKFGQDLYMAVIHRTGRLELGECAVWIGVSSTIPRTHDSGGPTAGSVWSRAQARQPSSCCLP